MTTTTASVKSTTLVRASICHTPQNPFVYADGLAFFSDGALVIQDEHIVALGNYVDLSRDYANAHVLDYRGALILPGLIDTHVHYPQAHIIGALGLELLDWLNTFTFPEESRLAHATYAQQVAQRFLKGLIRNGTTTALVFGAHFPQAQAELFDQAAHTGLTVISGLVTSDQNIPEALCTTAERAYEENKHLIETYHHKGRLAVALMPRFSVSASEAILEVTGTLQREYPELIFHTHINENLREIAFVKELFPWAKDYLDTYAHYGLVHQNSIFAHNVHVSEREYTLLRDTGAKVAHCPSSNMFIGSGLFEARRHLAEGIPFALASDVGGGTGYSLFKEGLMAYQAQMLQPQGQRFTGAELLYLATLSGAEVLGLAHELGDLTPGKRADFIVIRAPENSTLADALGPNNTWVSPERLLGGVFTLAREDAITAVYAGGKEISSISQL